MFGVTQECVNARFAPPRDVEVEDTFGKVRGARLVDEEVVVVELDRVRAVARGETSHNASGTLCGLSQPAAANHVDHRAEVAEERTTVAGVMWQRVAAHKGSS